MVGRWLLRAIAVHRRRLEDEHGIELQVVALANRRDFVHRQQGIEIEDALALGAAGRSLADMSGTERWPTALAGLEATMTDVLVEVSQSPAGDGEPGISHIRRALRSGASVATSNKWPVALAGVELSKLARERGAGLRAESTVMSGTPVLTALTNGLGGATPIRLRGLLNATVNKICSRLAEGVDYEDALAEAQGDGLAEADPGADVEGLDSVGKLMILSALVFGVQLRLEDVECRGISTLTQHQVTEALARGARPREVSSLDPEAGVHAVKASLVSRSDPLFDVDGTDNVVGLEVDPIGTISVRGPGAGPQLAGQGVFSDLIALALERKRMRS